MGKHSAKDESRIRLQVYSVTARRADILSALLACLRFFRFVFFVTYIELDQELLSSCIYIINYFLMCNCLYR